MDRIKFITGLLNTVFDTGYLHVTKGAPLASWDLKFHLIYNIIKKSMDFKPGQSLKVIRNNMDINVNPPPRGFHITKTYIPDYYRELSYNIIKDKLIKEI
ncbi:hypothetical protein K502DRAFT_353694, partial [Neoconidiobolus thromboides FSU 785]